MNFAATKVQFVNSVSSVDFKKLRLKYKEWKMTFATFIAPMAWLMALMLAPHSLALAGTLASHLGAWQLICLVLIGGLFILNAGVPSRIRPTSPISSATLSDRASIVLLLSSRLTTALTGSVILAVSAGFIFNEIFIYWFPNFAFAYLVLTIVVIIQFLGSTAKQWAQVIFTGIAAAGLVVLVLFGLIHDPTVASIPVKWGAHAGVHSVIALMYLFVGFDLVFLSPAAQSAATGRKLKLVRTGIIGAAIILGLWSLVSIRHVEVDRLGETAVPHVIAAMNLAGPAGLKIIGLVSIAGAFAGINALLTALSQVVTDLRPGPRNNDHQPSVMHRVYHNNRPGFWTLGFGLLIALMLAAGLAGTDAVDVMLRAGLIFWMIHHAAANWNVLNKNRLFQKWSARTIKMAAKPAPLIGLIMLWLGIGVLIATDSGKWLLIRFMGGVYALMWSLIAIIAKLRRQSNHARISIVKRPHNNNKMKNQRRSP
jgi:hypothetical protein